MPTIFRYAGLRFFFYSNEGEPREPVHVHVVKDGCEAKVWVTPEVMVARSRGFDTRALREVERIVIRRHEEIVRAWNEHFA